MTREGFSSRFGLIAATLGMAIGTGNIWRFPRIVANYEGGAFLIPWIVFLFTWSIPILIAEFTLGKTTGRGPIGAFSKLLGKRAAWMGAFMALVTLMIGTYYSVVAGWTLHYLVEAIRGMPGIAQAATPSEIQQSHAQAVEMFRSFAVRENFEAVADPSRIPASLWYHLIVVAIGALIVWRGVRGGVELACKFLVPMLFLLLLCGSIYVLTALDGAKRGLQYFFSPNLELLAKPDIWIDALSQSAWSTGAGFGLFLAYGAYAPKNTDAVTTSRVTALGNNTASLLAGLFLFPAVFALLSQAGMAEAEIQGALKDNGPGNSGLAFTYIPFIFKGLGDSSRWLTIAFFAGLFAAALSSLLSLYEMGARCLLDMGVTRQRAIVAIAVVCALLGGVSAIDMDFFVTMDWIWGVALVLGGMMIAFAVQTYGAIPYRERLINATGATRPLGPAFQTLFVFLIPAQALGLLAWWLRFAATDPTFFGEGNDPWDPTRIGTLGIGPTIAWWITAFGLLWAASPWIGKWSLRGEPERPDDRPCLWIRPLGIVLAASPWVLWQLGVRAGDFSLSLDAPPAAWKVVAAALGLVLGGGFCVQLVRAARAGHSERDGGDTQGE